MSAIKDPAWVTWQRALFERLSDGGIWLWPSGGGIYQIDKQNKALREIVRVNDESGREDLQWVLAEMGWTLIEAAS